MLGFSSLCKGLLLKPRGFRKQSTSFLFSKTMWNFDMSCVGEDLVKDAVQIPIFNVGDNKKKLICDRHWSSQVKDVVLAAIINVIWVIWYCRIKIRFDNKIISCQAAINLVVANVAITVTFTSGCMGSSMQ